jgi:precorrin-2/cobalt-factor-2 C20-methyltransferase
MSGTLYGIGVGPGDPELLTLKAARLLGEVSVIAYPVARGSESVARKIAVDFLAGAQTEIVMSLKMETKDSPEHAIYDKAAIEISQHLDQGEDVAVLCEGDPFFYGSFMYLFHRLGEKYPIEVVPGISSLAAGAAALEMPLASRNEVLTVLPAPLPEGALRQGLAHCQTAVIIKLGRHGPKVFQLLEGMQLLDQTAYVEYASHSHQRTAPARQIEPTETPYFSMLIMRKPGTLA